MLNNSLNTSKSKNHHQPTRTGNFINTSERNCSLSPIKPENDLKSLKQNLLLNNPIGKYRKLKRQPSTMIPCRHRILLKNYYVNFQMPKMIQNINEADADDNNNNDSKNIGMTSLYLKPIRPLKCKVLPPFKNKDISIMKPTKVFFNSEIITSSPIIKKNVTIAGIIAGQLSNLSIGVINENYKNYSKPIKSNDINSTDYIRAFAANTYQGIYNEKNHNKILVILKVSQPQRKKDQEWPCCSIFGLFDGMDGYTCSEFLRNELHQYIMRENMFPGAMDKAMIEGYEKADIHFLKSTLKVSPSQGRINNHQKGMSNNSINSSPSEVIIEKSGSCALEIFFMNFVCYIANVGDSKVFLIKNNLEDYEQVTTCHNSTNSHENKRIIRNGGIFKTLPVQMTTKMNDNNNSNSNSNSHLPCYEYVFPGKCRTTRVMGKIEGKLKQSNDKGKILISTPDVISLRIRRDIDFVLVGNFELFTKLTIKDVIECIRMIFNNQSGYYDEDPDCHLQCSLAVELIIKTALHREAIGNVSCILIMIRK